MKITKRNCLITIIILISATQEISTMNWFGSKPPKTIDPAQYAAAKALQWAKKNPKTAATVLLTVGAIGGYMVWDWYCSASDTMPTLTEHEAGKKLIEAIDHDLQTARLKGDRSVMLEKFPKAGAYMNDFSGCMGAYLSRALAKYTRLFQACMSTKGQEEYDEFQKAAIALKKQVQNWLLLYVQVR